ncbi:MAG: putative nodulation protein noeI-putative methyltransferase [Betaproteobacteria bacterium]|nr:putative nodulation protein noeI-putative methyltransferase [Betaproteobacteria bacterium]
MKRLLAILQQWFGRSRICARLAVKIRNQADAVIRNHLNDGVDMASNGELWLLEKVAPRASCFVDVGANVGAWSTAFLKRMTAQGRGLLFEPSPSALALLETNMHKTGRAGSLEVIQAAVSDRVGTQVFFTEAAAGETSSLVPGHSLSNAQRIEVALTTIDAELAHRGIDVVDMLKVDAEGFDLHVLRGADQSLRAGKIAVVQFEYNTPWAIAGSTLADAIRLFESVGYDLYLLRADGVYAFDYRFYGEYFGYSNFVAFAPGAMARFGITAKGTV